MEDLFDVGIFQGNVRRAASGGFFRSHSSLANGLCNQECSDCSDSECGNPAPSSRRIALAKRVLNEATRSFTPCLSISSLKSDKCKNTGALGPLMSMIQSECDLDALRSCMDTMSFLLLDKANRKVVHDLGGLSLLMSIFTRESDWQLLRMVLDCVCSLVKADDAEKLKVWRHPGKAGLLALINPRAGVPHLLETLCLVRKIAFRGQQRPMELYEPLVLASASDVLASHQPAVVVNKVCKLLRWCAEAAGNEHFDLWKGVLTRLTPQLRDPGTCEGALGVLLSLSEHLAHHNLFAPSGVVPAVLGLLTHPSRGVCVTASCIMSTLCEGNGLSRAQLCTEPCLIVLLRALSAPAQHSDVAVAIVYALNKLITFQSEAVVEVLLKRGAPQTIVRVLPRWTDQELVMGAMQVLQAMGTNPEAVLSTMATSSISSPTASHRGADARLLQLHPSGVFAQPGLILRDSSPAPSSPDSSPREAIRCGSSHGRVGSHLELCMRSEDMSTVSSSCLVSATSLELFNAGRSQLMEAVCSSISSTTGNGDSAAMAYNNSSPLASASSFHPPRHHEQASPMDGVTNTQTQMSEHRPVQQRPVHNRLFHQLLHQHSHQLVCNHHNSQHHSKQHSHHSKELTREHSMSGDSEVSITSLQQGRTSLRDASISGCADMSATSDMEGAAVRAAALAAAMPHIGHLFPLQPLGRSDMRCSTSSGVASAALAAEMYVPMLLRTDSPPLPFPGMMGVLSQHERHSSISAPEDTAVQAHVRHMSSDLTSVPTELTSVYSRLTSGISDTTSTPAKWNSPCYAATVTCNDSQELPAVHIHAPVSKAASTQASPRDRVFIGDKMYRVLAYSGSHALSTTNNDALRPLPRRSVDRPPSTRVLLAAATSAAQKCPDQPHHSAPAPLELLPMPISTLLRRLPGEPRQTVGVRSWSCQCLSSLGGEILA